MSKELDELKAKVAKLEAEEARAARRRLWHLVMGPGEMSRGDMIVLRDMLTEEIRKTYDSDDE